MTIVEVDLQTINTFLSPDLGLVQLIPGLSANAEVDPELLPTVPYVMSDFILVANNNYVFPFNFTRYLKLGYFLSRDEQFESGEFDIISKVIQKHSGEFDPGTSNDPPAAFAGSASDLHFHRTVIQRTSGDLGVDFTLLVAPTTLPFNPSFGIAYKITNASPAVFPSLRIFVIKLLPTDPKE